MVNFTSLSKTAKASTPTRTAPTEAAVETAPEPQAVGQERGLSLFNSSDVGAALLAVTEHQSSRQTFAFPVIEVTPGNTGGAFRPMKGTPEDIADEMPQGSKPIPCIFLGYRTKLFAWTAGQNVAGEKASKPAWSCNVPCTNAEDAKLIVKAMEKHTFTKKANKAVYDYDTSDVGHIRSQFQALVFLPALDRIVTIQGVGLYKAWAGSCASAREILDPQGGFLKVPIMVSVSTTEEPGAEAWKLHVMEFTPTLNDKVDRVGIMKKFAAFGQGIQQDQTKMQEVMDWLACKDAPITDTLREKLKKSLTL